jgi:precorrin-8X/cobalt-precorrin-8 methylmutase
MNTVSDAAPTPGFDRIVMVDWSANSSPKRGRDSIWIASGTPPHGVESIVNCPTRSSAVAMVADVATAHPTERILVGFDFSFGYPAGFAPALIGEPHAAWSDVWRWFADHVRDDNRNRNDRFDVAAQINAHLLSSVGSAPFWGYPGRPRSDALPRTRSTSHGPFDTFRLCEHRVRNRGHRPFSAWQLAYAGSVGSQIMMGLRSLEGLRRDPHLGDRVRIWPFETGLGPTSIRVEPGEILIAEIWPSLFPLDSHEHPVRDAAQVMTLVDRFLDADRNGMIASWADPDLSEPERQIVQTEEGWTLGVT